jgi:hypothetical protein
VGVHLIIGNSRLPTVSSCKGWIAQQNIPGIVFQTHMSRMFFSVAIIEAQCVIFTVVVVESRIIVPGSERRTLLRGERDESQKTYARN